MKHLINEITSKYAENNLDFAKALSVWKEANFTPREIKIAIKEDCSLDVTNLQASEIYRHACEASKFTVETPKDETVSSKRKQIAEKMKKSKYIRMTPDVRACVEKIGSNRYRSRFGSVEWSIQIIDGEPHLARRDTDEDGRSEKLGDKKKASSMMNHRTAITVDPNLTDTEVPEENMPFSQEATPMNDVLTGRAGVDQEEIINYLVRSYGMSMEDAQAIFQEAADVERFGAAVSKKKEAFFGDIIIPQSTFTYISTFLAELNGVLAIASGVEPKYRLQAGDILDMAYGPDMWGLEEPNAGPGDIGLTE